MSAADRLPSAGDEESPEAQRMPLLPKGCEEKRYCGLTMKSIAWSVPLIYSVLGILLLRFVEGWPFLTSSYVMVQVITTIGYGDFTVQSSGCKIYLAFYAIIVLTLFAYYINLCRESIANQQSSVLRQYMRNMEGVQDAGLSDDELKMKYGAFNQLISALLLFVLTISAATVFFRLAEHCTCSYGLQSVAGCKDPDFETCRATGGYVKNWIDSFYMSAITMTTVGFGDFQPRTHWGRIFAIIWMPISVAVAANMVGACAAYFFEERQQNLLSAKDAVDHIALSTFKKIDKDGTGLLTRGEFLSYMLLKYGGVSEDLITEINKEYDKIDVNKTNRVSYEMVQSRQKMIRDKIKQAKKQS